jgi:hypothetical protein
MQYNTLWKRSMRYYTNAVRGAIETQHKMPYKRRTRWYRNTARGALELQYEKFVWSFTIWNPFMCDIFGRPKGAPATTMQ